MSKRTTLIEHGVMFAQAATLPLDSLTLMVFDAAQANPLDDDLLGEIGFAKGVRGKFYRAEARLSTLARLL